MIGKELENNEEETELKITDKRKFNVDGSLREGVVIEKEEQIEQPQPAQTGSSGVIRDRSEDVISHTAGSPQPAVAKETPGPDDDEISEEDLLDDDDPASFVNFLSTLVTNAAAALGAMPHPVTGQKSVDLETGKYWIDVLTMLREKTKGNLKATEEKLLKSIIGDLQMQYIALSRADEEKLKARAAQKFSSKDILGG